MNANPQPDFENPAVLFCFCIPAQASNPDNCRVGSQPRQYLYQFDNKLTFLWFYAFIFFSFAAIDNIETCGFCFLFIRLSLMSGIATQKRWLMNRVIFKISGLHA